MADAVTVHTTDLMSDLRLSATQVQWQPGAGPEQGALPVDPTRQYQSMVGFGASMTDSSARNLAGLSTAQHTEVFKDLFGPDRLRMGLLRVPLGASDFSGQGSYTYDDLPEGQRDDKLRQLSLDKDKDYVLSQLIAASKAAGSDLTLIGSPWSAPAWMKDSSSLNGGGLRADFEEVFARYLTKIASLYNEAGLPLDYLTIQNEPLHTSDGYPTMLVTAEQAQSVTRDLESILAKDGLDTKVLAYDHNWDVTAYASHVLANSGTAVEGTAWHCYGGKAVTQSQVHNAFPSRTAHLTECSGGDWQGSTAQAFDKTMYVLTQAPANWARSVTLWNLALDENNGPTNGGCDNCRGVITVHPDGSWTKEIDYWALAHFSKFVSPGAKRIASGTLDNLNSVAFTNPDGTHVLVANNTAAFARQVSLRFGERHAVLTVPAHGAVTATWTGAGHSLPTGGTDLRWSDGITASFNEPIIDGMDSLLIDGRWVRWNAPAGAGPRLPGTLKSLNKAHWVASASNESAEASKAVDGDETTRWSSGTGLSDGQWLQIDLGTPTEFDRIVLDNAQSPNDFSRNFSIEISGDSQQWKRIARATGTPSSTEVQLAPTKARYLRILNHSNSGSWWSVHGVDILRTVADKVPATGILLTAAGEVKPGLELHGWYNPGNEYQRLVTRVGSVTLTSELPPQGAFTIAYEGDTFTDSPTPDEDGDQSEPSESSSSRRKDLAIGLPNTGT